MKKILLAENNEDFAYVIQIFFEKKGYKILKAITGKEAIELFERNLPDIVLLDINLNDTIDGKQVARNIRKIDKKTPIIFMSGESKEPRDVVEAFDIGCNFFLKKPVSLDELEVHINALEQTHTAQDIYKFDQCIFSFKERALISDGKKEKLSEKESNVLQYLCDHLGETVRLADITENVWDDAFMEESLRNIISSLRKKIKDKGLKINTLKNVGYQLEEI
ncbi:response regulator transcription factor [Ornithobacterium rhinotracheale]|uniref:response regulator transcription factor n=1 Tax=Ornithobacterium rhinotracheale TaxID=28251 RepID=UPI001FF11A84|nr:response regulator transcription factor [Ornithobacterium rhinotracheale]MCK0206294.1 response regulator transcription factor [Ornithobacterium rhinotracheale]